MAELRHDIVEYYDEFSMMEPYAAFAGIPWKGRPQVARWSVEAGPNQRVSMLLWGEGEPELVFLHGSGQNSHTWDTVALALERPVVAIDLPGHGHSDWRDDGDYGPWANAEAMASAIEVVAPRAVAVVGMSLGGLTAVRLATQRPDLVRRLVVVDLTPGIGARAKGLTPQQRGAVALLGGPPVFDTLDDMLAATAATMPGRTPESVRPGVLHNAKQLDDGRWAWRYDQFRPPGREAPPLATLWTDLASLMMPVMLVRGARSAMVHDDDVAEFRRRSGQARIETVEGAGHSVQSDRPVELAQLVEDFVHTTA